MRAAVVCLAFSVAVALTVAGCTATDPDLAKPCGQRRPASVRVGIGQYNYVPLGMQGPLVDTDLQLGDYVWMGIGCRGLGPDVTVNFGITDTASGTVLSVTNDQRVELAYDSSNDVDQVGGLGAYFDFDGGAPDGGPSSFSDVEQLVGDSVTLWADVTDACYPAPLHAETATQIEGFDDSTCVGCIDQACAPQLAKCAPGSECRKIQACLDTYCINLSTLASPDEAACQAYCQGQHPTGKAAHIGVVACVQACTCNTEPCVPNPVDGGTPVNFCYVQPPCFAFSIDYQHCVNTQNDPVAGPCADQNAACVASPDCQLYKTCINACTTWPGCQECAAKWPAGEEIFEWHQLCLENTCLAQGWLQHLAVWPP